MYSTNPKPNTQSFLLGYDNLFRDMVKLYENKKLPNKILFSGLKGIGKATFAYHLINYILSKSDEFAYDLLNFEINNSNKSFNLVQKNSHPNFYLIDLLDEKRVIEIAQIREMINYSNKSSFNNKEKIVLIDNAENLNPNSSNALLKIIEEPNDNILFILIFDNTKKILDTIKSRCIKFNFSLSSQKSIDITNKIIDQNVQNLLNGDLINYYNTISDYVDLINLSESLNIDLTKINLKTFIIKLIESKSYKKNINIKKNIFKFIELYLLKLIYFNKSSKRITFLYDSFIKKMFYLNKFNLDDESFFIELKSKILNG